ncbi:hypothetical protein H6G54_28310 [Anabaena cylindrica FACHB-243]|uniref:Uncharacterized protein n=1 Tax=Anabaena cylindrica (strain ATCC 27899 / PCC 7122) TaxID=272123 RepID=K9ZF73_ANACC|nr:MULTISPECIES: hypothetical protein [Anabaena]AFZ57015.1 hypothetical protein Anacy_1508 [Anabaena cylindrica PCC 7122]MBD2421513.1 hypothetical protein [Anabaena cylindrica FACHB-243]MBY5283757.1 hypothetical protein [Anabaena sp. CCAP 1446/1C]MBY5309375.1 hypothetical protein [Anabaena sp. CCAP 1446/1C]MCM2407726.1 hypothetical protein [Anabaena sp. CCAP 1446/1C]
MNVDNYREATALTKKLEASLPIKAKAAKELLKMLKTRGDIINPDKEFEIDWVAYSGDEGGIMCRLVSKNDNPEDEDKAQYVVSITHLKIDPDHPHAEEIVTYQRERNRQLMLQNRSSLITELMPSRPSKPKKSSKGFGK